MTTPVNRDKGLYARVDEYVALHSPYTAVVSGVRSAISLALLLTLLVTPRGSLFFQSLSYPEGTVCRGGPATNLSLFCWSSEPGWLGIAYWVAVAVLVVGGSGVLPQLTGLPLWYVVWSFSVSSTAVDGGDQLAANLLLILAAYSLLDRRWHGWKLDHRYGSRRPILQYLPHGLLLLAVGQLIGVYLQSSVAKLAVSEWADGSALWYWMQNPAFSPGEPVVDWLLAFLAHPLASVALTYGVLALQIWLCIAPFCSQRVRFITLMAATLFHLSIAGLLGLWSFSIVMIAADLLLLTRPHEHARMPNAWRRT